MDQEQNNQNLNQEQNNQNMNLNDLIKKNAMNVNNQQTNINTMNTNNQQMNINVEEYFNNKTEYSGYHYNEKKCVRNMIISSINLFIISKTVARFFILWFIFGAFSGSSFKYYSILLLCVIYMLWSVVYFIKSIVRICAKEKMKKKYDLYVYGGVVVSIVLFILYMNFGQAFYPKSVKNLDNKAKGHTFTTYIKEIYKTSQQQWMIDSMNNNIKYKSYSKCDKGCTNSLDLSIDDDYDYYVFLDKYGNVRVLYATDGKYQYSFEGDNLKIENIKVEDCLDISKLDKNEVITISYYGKYDPNYEKRIDLFKTQIVELYKSIQQQWLMETMLETKDMVYKEYDENKTSNKFQVKYYVFIDKNGKIKKFYATNGEFQFTFKGESMMINEIDLNNIIDVSKINESDIIDFSKIEE